MKNALAFIVIILFAACGEEEKKPEMAAEKRQEVFTAEWTSLFDGKSLDGWKVNENKESVRLEDGAIVVNGPRAHVFYDGDVSNHNFKDFEFQAQVMTFPGSNSGIFAFELSRKLFFLPFLPNSRNPEMISNLGFLLSKSVEE